MRNAFPLYVAAGLAVTCHGQYPQGTFLNGDKDALEAFSNYAPLHGSEFMDEDTLNHFSNDTAIYRFTWFRSFHNPIIIRLTMANGTGELNWKELHMWDRTDTSNRMVDARRPVSKEELSRFVQLFDAMVFYQLPREGPESGEDGATWTLEACSDHYWAVERWSPDSGAFHDCCLFLLHLSGLKVNVNDIY